MKRLEIHACARKKINERERSMPEWWVPCKREVCICLIMLFVASNHTTEYNIVAKNAALLPSCSCLKITYRSQFIA
jgi:hypothetical protein